jgi:nucleotide-binding universal stress UspA family protein
MERIVLGYDGTPAAASALSWTAVRAAHGPTRVDVVLVTSPFGKDPDPGLETLAHAEAFLLERLPGLEVELHRVEGKVTESIARAARDADLVVIGINTGHPIRAAAAGWTPLRLSTRSTTPVYMIPAGWVAGDDPVTVGIADDDTSDAALEAGVAEAAATSMRLRLVHSWLMPTPVFDPATTLTIDPDAVLDAHRQTLDTAVERVRKEHPALSVERQLIRDSRSAALLRFASRSSLLVIGTHRRGVLVGSLLGSVGREILWRADCPICVVPPQWRNDVPFADLITAAPVASDRDE